MPSVAAVAAAAVRACAMTAAGQSTPGSTSDRAAGIGSHGAHLNHPTLNVNHRARKAGSGRSRTSTATGHAGAGAEPAPPALNPGGGGGGPQPRPHGPRTLRSATPGSRKRARVPPPAQRGAEAKRLATPGPEAARGGRRRHRPASGGATTTGIPTATEVVADPAHVLKHPGPASIGGVWQPWLIALNAKERLTVGTELDFTRAEFQSLRLAASKMRHAQAQRRHHRKKSLEVGGAQGCGGGPSGQGRRAACGTPGTMC